MLVLALTLGTLVALVGLSTWVARELPDEGLVPVHFDLRGNPDRFGSRWLVLGAVPVSYLLLACVMSWAGAFTPSQDTGEILASHGAVSAVLLAAQGLIVFLLMRWARRQ